jgi:hypothetical protein
MMEVSFVEFSTAVDLGGYMMVETRHLGLYLVCVTYGLLEFMPTTLRQNLTLARQFR